MKEKKWLEKEKELRAKWSKEKRDMEKKRKRLGCSGKMLKLEFDYDDDDFYDDASTSFGRKYKKKGDECVGAVKEGQQIFTHDSAAFQILSNEMINLLKTGESDGFICDTLEDSLYTWTVRVGKFEPDGELSKELELIRNRFGYDFIELQLDFIPDFPFYPPLLRVVRPRFKGSMVQSLANIDLLKLTYWNPAKSVREVLIQIKEILQKHARLDVMSERNELGSKGANNRGGAYLPLEDFLIKLALATEVRPRANFEIINVDNLTKAPQVKRMKAAAHNEESSVKVMLGKYTGGWAKGVGYGSGHSINMWKPEDLVKAQREKDRQILNILSNILHCIKGLQENTEKIDTVEVYDVLEGSALVPFLEGELDYPSFIEIARHLEKYRLILELIEAIADHPFLLPLLSNLPRQKKCVLAMLHDVSQTAANYLQHLNKSSVFGQHGSGKGDSSESATQGLQASSNSTKKETKFTKLKALFTGESSSAAEDAPSSAINSAEKAEDLEKENAERITGVFDKLQKLLLDQNLSYSLEEQDDTACMDWSRASSINSRELDEEELLESAYKKALKEHQFGDFPVVVTSGAPWAHHYSKNANDPFTKEVKAVFREWTALKASLPLNLASSVFVRVDESQANLMQALIVGPEGTPYANGLFLFDICFPVGYPHVPPHVNSRTNGGGRVRFNPNLYENGKVCLSLLGTWSGESGEQWNANTSTLLQVLVSIQSLILVEDPYFNEPGYESTMGTEEGKRASEEYSRSRRAECVKWAMLEQLKNPPPAFEKVVKIHFKMKKEKIAKQFEKWQELDAKNKDLKKYCTGTLEEIEKG